MAAPTSREELLEMLLSEDDHPAGELARGAVDRALDHLVAPVRYMNELIDVLDRVDDMSYEQLAASFATAGENPDEVVARTRARMLEVIEQFRDQRDAELLDPNYPIELVEAELLAHGMDPVAVGARGAALVRTLLTERLRAARDSLPVGAGPMTDQLLAAQKLEALLHRHRRELSAAVADMIIDRPDQVADVSAFHKAAGIAEDVTAIELRRRLCEEETAELAAGFGYHAPPWVPRVSLVDEHDGSTDRVEPDLVEIADGAVDAAYVAVGTLIQLFGLKCARALWDEVQRSNMNKFPGGVATVNEHGKVIKPEGWTPPDIAGVLRAHGIALPEHTP